MPSPDLDLFDVQVWNHYWAEVERRISPSFSRSDAATQAVQYLAGLLSPAERKPSWQLAEICGAANPYGVQHLLGRAIWDADALRDCLRSYIRDYLATSDAVGVIDESGFLKKGTNRLALPGNTAAPLVVWRTARSGCFLPAPVCRATP